MEEKNERRSVKGIAALKTVGAVGVLRQQFAEQFTELSALARKAQGSSSKQPAVCLSVSCRFPLAACASSSK